MPRTSSVKSWFAASVNASSELSLSVDVGSNALLVNAKSLVKNTSLIVSVTLRAPRQFSGFGLRAKIHLVRFAVTPLVLFASMKYLPLAGPL